MRESVAIAKETNAKKGFSPTKSDKSVHRVWNEPERQLGSLGDVIGNITRDGGTPSVESIATELISMHTTQRAPVLLALQQTHGNRYVQRVVSGIQAKLVVGQPGDVYERETDGAADAVMQMPELHVQRQVEEEEEDEFIQSKLHAVEISQSAQRRVEEEEETLHAEETSAHISDANLDLESRIRSLQGGGQSLPEYVRTFFGPRFGYDFSHVRVHTDAHAVETARALNAQAFTVGGDIVFGAGQYAPESHRGKTLLAHELTHVVQQDGGATSARSVPVNKTDEQLIQGGFFGKIWKGIKKAAGAVWKGVKSVGGAIWRGLKAAGSFTWGAVKAIGKWGWNVLKSAGAWVWDLVTEAPIRIWRLLKHIGSGIVGTVSWLWKGIKGAFGHVWEAIKGVFKWAGKGVIGLFSWIWEGLRDGAQWAWRLLNGDFSGFFEGIGGFFSWIGDGAVRLAKWGWNGLKAAAIWAWEGTKGLGKWLWDGFLSGAAWVGRLIGKLLDLVGFGEIMDLLWQIIKFNTRPLTSTEIGEAKKVFRDSINYWQVRIDEYSFIAWLGSKFAGSRYMGVVTFHTINFNRKITATPGSGDMAWLIHELTHVSQMEHAGMQYMGEALYAQATAGYSYTLGKPHFRDYNREQQADIAKDYYLALTSGRSTTAYAPYIAELRAGDL